MDITTLLYYDKVTPDFAAKEVTIAGGLNIVADWLMYTMGYETEYTFSPSIQNPNSSATGLIQFLESTAVGLGTTTAALAQMTAIDQLDYVQEYYQGVISQYGQLNTIADVYLAVFYPAAIPWSMDTAFPASVYAANTGLDANKDGILTKADILQTIANNLPAGYSNLVAQTNLYMNRVLFAGSIVLIALGVYMFIKFLP